MYKSIVLAVNAVLSCAIFICGCTVGPNYKKPVASVPPTYRGLAPDANGNNATVNSLGDEKWWDVFQDEQLRALIRTALEQNYDVRIAGARIWRPRRSLVSLAPTSSPTSRAGRPWPTSAPPRLRSRLSKRPRDS